MSTLSKLPERADVVPEVMGTTLDGKHIRLSDWHGRKNIVLLMTGRNFYPRMNQLAMELAARMGELQAENAQVLCVAADDASPALRAATLPFPVISDNNGENHRRVGAVNAAGQPEAAICITDRYGQVYFAEFCSGENCPSAEEVLEWLRFIEIQCPECGDQNWPIAG